MASSQRDHIELYPPTGDDSDLDVAESRYPAGMEHSLQSCHLDASVADKRDKLLIAVVDEHSFTRECIARSLQELDSDFDTVEFASSAGIADSGKKCALIFLHVHLIRSNQEALQHVFAEISELAEVAPVIVLCSSIQCDFMLDAFNHGASGCVPTENTSLALAGAIMNLVRAGGIFVPLSSLLLALPTPAEQTLASGDRFTERETTILTLLKQGKANKIIAYELHLSESTVKVHLRNIMRKMKVTNRTEVVSRSLSGGDGGHPIRRC